MLCFGIIGVVLLQLLFDFSAVNKDWQRNLNATFHLFLVKFFVVEPEGATLVKIHLKSSWS